MEENKTESVKEKNGGLNTIRTFSSDIADSIHNDQMSVIRVALAEQKKKEENKEFEKAEGTPISKILWTFGAVILLLAGIMIVYFVFLKKSETLGPVKIVNTDIKAFIPYEEKVFLDATNVSSTVEISSLINKEVSISAKKNSIKAIFITSTSGEITNLVTSKDLLSLLGPTAPGELIRSLADEYMTGSYLLAGDGEVPHLFIMFKTKDYNMTYASMLTWEKTMLDDMWNVFKIDIGNDNGKILDSRWKDIVIDNKDARVLYGQDNKPLLYYLFINKSYFIITDSKDAIREINLRLITSNAKPL